MTLSILPHPSAFRPEGPPALWGGLECSVVRVGARLRDQFHETGHHERPGDLAATAALGLRTLRYPVSWERVAPHTPDDHDWAWHDARLGEMRRLGITPIVGLVHHGSGPGWTGLLDPRFPPRLAAFAGAVARRYPWVVDWTPVNEPLTTARFAGLYGHWYPHGNDEHSFLRMVAIQCQAVLLAMRAIRQVVPTARLVQTEDLGRVFATAPLQAQADYENQRRWLSLDLLLSRVGSSHPFYPRLRAAGVDEAVLDDLRTGDLAPVVLGFNHYITSERFLDHRMALHPAHTHGGNGRARYADTEAARMPMPTGQTGWLPRLREAWQRYPDTPLAVTEVHLGSTPDEQIRWLAECWQAAMALRGAGANLIAVTPWALFGAVDWCSLLTRADGRYEPGAFHAAPGQPVRATALATAIATLAQHGQFEDAAAAVPGWWERADRIAPGLRRAQALLPVQHQLAG